VFKGLSLPVTSSQCLIYQHTEHRSVLRSSRLQGKDNLTTVRPSNIKRIHWRLYKL